MRCCSCFFLVLVLAAASAGSLVASQKDVSEEKRVLQPQSSGSGSGLQQQPDGTPEILQLPVRRAGAASRRRGGRLRLRRQRRADREARIVNRDPDNVSEGVGRASGEPSLKRSGAGTEEDDANEANLQEAVELASRSKQLPEQGDTTSRTSILAEQGQKEADSVPLKEVASQPVESKTSAAVSSAQGEAQQEAIAKPGVMDQVRPGDLNGRQKSSEPLPHDGGSQEGSGAPGDLGKEHSYPALDTPGNEPYDSSQSAITLGKNRASDSDGAEAGLHGEQLRDGAQLSSEAGRSRDSKPAAGKSAVTGGHVAGMEEDARSGKVPGGGSKAGSAKSGAGAKSGGQPGGGSKSSDAKIGTARTGNGEAGSGERTGGGAGADDSEKEPASRLESLHDAIALLQKDDVGDGIFELANEDEEDDEETGGAGTRRGAAGNTKNRKDKQLQNQAKPGGSSSAKTADQNNKARASRNEQSSADKADQERRSGAEVLEQSDDASAKQQKKAAASKSESSSAESADQRGETQASRPADQSKESDRDGQPEQETEEEERSVPRTFDRLLDHLKVASFLDVPCGDGDQVSSKVDHFPTGHPDDIRYIGVDDSEATIAAAASVHGDTPNWNFHVQDYVHKSLPKADLLVSRAALLRPDMLTLVDMLENFARSGASYLLLGSFKELTFADPSISTGMESDSGNSKESGREGVEDGGVPYFVSLQQEPFGLDAPLQVFPEPEGFGAKFGAAAAKSGNTAKTGESAKAGKVDKSGDDAKPEKNAKSGDGAKAEEGATSQKLAASHDDGKSGMVNRHMLLYSGDYLRQQDFSDMRDRVELFLYSQ